MLTRDRQVLTTADGADCEMETSEQQGYGADQMFCLRWSNHQTNLLNVFNQLRHNESFVDVTLAVDGRVLKAHKMVLSACSPYFQKMFEMTPDKHPVVFIDRVFYQDMKRLLEFMYRGEVSVDQETLNRFLKVARSLRIRGLTEIEEPLAEPSHFTPNGDPIVSPSIEESCRQRLAEQMAAAALAECRTGRHSSATIRLTGEPEPRSRSASGEAPRKLRRVHSERPPPPTANDSLKIELERPLRAESDDINQRRGSGDGCRTASEAVAQDLTSDTDRDRSETGSSPHLIKQEQDVFCQPDIWISEGIFVDGQNAPSGAGGGPAGGGGPSAVPRASSAHTSQSGGRSTASPPSALEEFMSSPEEPGTLLDYITHDDGSVTCKLCGEQVPSRNHWYRHKYRTHAWHTYKCDECGITYKSKRGFEAHLEAKHDRPPPERRERDVGRRRDWEGMARAIEDTRKKREEELVSDIINRVKRECAMEGGDYTRRGYLKHF